MKVAEFVVTKRGVSYWDVAAKNYVVIEGKGHTVNIRASPRDIRTSALVYSKN